MTTESDPKTPPRKDRATYEELETERARYFELYNLTPVPCFNLSPEGTILLANQASACLFELEPIQLVGRKFGLFLVEPDRLDFETLLRLAFSCEKSHSCQLSLDRGSGQSQSIQLKINRSPTGKELFVVLVDVSAVKHSESIIQRLESIIELFGDAIISTDLQGIITDWNRGANQVLGYHSSQMVGTSISSIIPPERNGEQDKILATIKRGENVNSFASLRRTNTGQLISVIISGVPIRNSAGHIIGITQILKDVTRQEQHEREISRFTRLYSALSHINQSIVWATTRDDLFRNVCQILVKDGGFRMTWIGWHDSNTQTLLPVAEFGSENGYLQSITVYTDDRPEGCGPTGTAFREGRTVICNDMLNDPATLPWQADVTRCGWRASAAFPIRVGATVCGALSVYSEESGFFRDREIALLEEAAVDVSFALENFRKEEERQRVQHIVKNERDFSNAVINSLPGVLYLYDQQGQFLRWNMNFERVTGYNASEIAVMHPLDFFPLSERETVAARIGDVFISGESRVEAGFLTKHGQVIPYYFTGITTQIDGQTCLVGVGIDVSERRKAEEARRLSDARYRTLFECAPDGILIASQEGTYIDANPSICRMLGYHREGLVGLNAVDIVLASEVQHIEPALDLIKSGPSYNREWQLKRRDGSVFPAEVIVTKMPDGKLLAMIRDITQRKQADMALRVLNQTLGLEVAERTRELQSALVRAESADRLKSSFLATMSHELRTPLNSIIGFTGVILQGLAGPLTPEQTKQLGMVRGSARHLLDLIRDVLDISKIEAGQLDVRTEHFDLPASIERVVASVRPLAERKHLSLTASVASDLGVMLSDRRRFEQILLNLVNNSIKFTDRGNVTVTAKLVSECVQSSAATLKPTVRISVTDTGIGIKPEDLETLFQPFRQIDTGTARMHEGTGLGLAICRRLTNLMGGEISATSSWPNGSTFTVTLPLSRSAKT